MPDPLPTADPAALRALADTVTRAVTGAMTGAGDDAIETIRAWPDAAGILPAVLGARAEVEGLRRREHELSALFSSARELAGVRDTDAVLTRLVERAHEMLGADVTYLSEFDPTTRELRVRATYGAVSPAFRSLVVPPGRGLVSAIVETRAPQSVARYGDYAADRHEAVVDDAVAAEGIVSMLGVPLRAEDTVLGVLFVAMRQERVFTPEQTALLTALADHASVVLQTARTLRSLRRSEEEARATLDELSAHLAARDRANTVHQQLVHAVLGGAGFSRIAETLASTFDRAVRILDERGEVRASAADRRGRETDAAGPAVDAAIDDSRRSGHATVVPHASGHRTVAALAAGSRLFGAVVVGSGAFDLDPVDLRTLERAAQVGALLALSEEAVADAQRRQQIDILVDLVHAAPERRADAQARLRRLGLDPAALDRLVVLAVPGDRRADALRTLARAVGTAGVVGEIDGVLVAVAEGGRLDLTASSARAELADRLDVAAVAVDAPGTDALPERFDLARRGLRILRALDAADVALGTDDLLPYAAVLDTDQHALSGFLEAAIGPVRAYDAERGTELLATLRAFVRNGGSPTRTARALTFHPNTILQRLDRLDRVLGADWRDDERLFRLSLAVRLDELRERLSAR